MPRRWERVAHILQLFVAQTNPLSIPMSEELIRKTKGCNFGEFASAKEGIVPALCPGGIVLVCFQ